MCIYIVFASCVYISGVNIMWLVLHRHRVDYNLKLEWCFASLTINDIGTDIYF